MGILRKDILPLINVNVLVIICTEVSDLFLSINANKAFHYTLP